jgi:hypothetical protein
VKEEQSEHESPRRMDLVHIAVGGGICFAITILIINPAQSFFQQTLFAIGMAGVSLFVDYYQVARDLFLLGLVYLPGGFGAGLYTGYNVYVDLNRILLIPAVIGTAGFIILVTIFGNQPVTSEFVGLMLVQLIGNAVGSYLGGYAINWIYPREES